MGFNNHMFNEKVNKALAYLGCSDLTYQDFQKTSITGANSVKRRICPQCGGGFKREITFTIAFDQKMQMLLYNCFRSTCGFKGSILITNANDKFPKPFGDIGAKKSIMTNSSFDHYYDEEKQKKSTFRVPKVIQEPLSKEQLDFFYSAIN